VPPSALVPLSDLRTLGISTEFQIREKLTFRAASVLALAGGCCAGPQVRLQVL